MFSRLQQHSKIALLHISTIGFTIGLVLLPAVSQGARISRAQKKPELCDKVLVKRRVSVKRKKRTDKKKIIQTQHILDAKAHIKQQNRNLSHHLTVSLHL